MENERGCKNKRHFRPNLQRVAERVHTHSTLEVSLSCLHHFFSYSHFWNTNTHATTTARTAAAAATAFLPPRTQRTRQRRFFFFFHPLLIPSFTQDENRQLLERQTFWSYHSPFPCLPSALGLPPSFSLLDKRRNSSKVPSNR